MGELDIEHCYRGTQLTAAIEDAGRIVFAGTACGLLSAAGGMALKAIVGVSPGRRSQPTDGWAFWQYRRADGSLGEIDELRRKLYERNTGVSLDDKPRTTA